MSSNQNKRAPRNRTITLNSHEYQTYKTRLVSLSEPASLTEILNTTICQSLVEALDLLPSNAFDLVFADPPYNLTKSFNQVSFSKGPALEYELWLETWLPKLARVLKTTGSIYVCGDWRSSASLYRVLERDFIVRNRITWEREKGRGAKRNWKNCSEDIWFSTVSDDYVFNVDSVKIRRRVIAPYTDRNGDPKDWDDTEKGRFRLTHPSNLWTDITVPFWSMPENTDHPTQKPEKLLAKIILASSNEGDVVLDPFLGSGTTSVTASKLGRQFVGIEIDEMYCCFAEKRLALAKQDRKIQGYSDDVFWERNTLTDQRKPRKHRLETDAAQPTLFSTEHTTRRTK